jgi:DNA repair protein RecN (Recombination protein N)
MLTYLRISNFAILDEVELTFGPGMTVLTGETGAGKSLVLDAVALLRGGRASADLIRTGADEARIEAVFAPPPGSAAEDGLRERLARLGLDAVALGDEGLVVRRVLGRGGRSRIHIAGQLSTAAVLGELCGGLIDISGQHEHQSLLEVSRHLRLLDRSGVPAERLDQMAQAFSRLQEASAALQAASLDERARAEREEFLRFQLNELDSVNPQAGEDETLRKEQKRLRSVEKLLGAAQRAETSLYSGEASVLEQLGVVTRELHELAALDSEVAGFATQLSEAQALLEDVAHGVRRYADTLGADPQRLQEIEDRLHLLGRLLRKHGPDLPTLLRKREEMAQALQTLTRHEEAREAAQAAVNKARTAAAAVAGELSRARQQVATELSHKASLALADLAMKGARLLPQLEGRTAQKGDDPALTFTAADGTVRRLGRDGWDRCELLLAANPGEEPRPLHRIASGGELSRVMLALRRILGQADRVATCVFDEVDAGIGGAVADRVGSQIRALGRNKQVICITHLPQIAAYGDDHFRVEKHVADGRTTTRVRHLTASERREEIARMLGGAKITAKSRAHAEELLREATGA